MDLYQLLTGSCLCIASKCDDRVINCSDISFSADNSFNPEQIEKVEGIILQQLDWKLAFPVILDFVMAYGHVLGLGNHSRSFWMMRYISELALQSPIYLNYKPSLIAASVVVLARFCLQERDLWPESLERESGYAWYDLEECIMALSRLLEDIRSSMPSLIMIERRYRQISRAMTANHWIPSVDSFASLTGWYVSCRG
jgi:hypothetical protein